MAESEGMIGYGSKFQYSTEVLPTAGATFNDLAEVTSITMPNPESDDIDFTHMESEDETKEQRPGLLDSGDASCEMNCTPAQLSTLYGLLRSRRTFRIVFPDDGDNETITFKGYVKSVEGEMPVDDKISCTVNIKVTSKPTMS